jgi:hypothetical protein
MPGVAIPATPTCTVLLTEIPMPVEEP